jgi:gas vesicle protein
MKAKKSTVKQTGDRTHPARPILGGFLVGSAIGIAAALLFAPRSGEETRIELRQKAIDLRDRTTDTVKDTVSQTKSKMYGLKDSVQEKARELQQRGKHMVSREWDQASAVAEDSTRTTWEQ